MSRPENLNEPVQIALDGTYYPSAPKIPPPGLQYTARYGSAVWFRPSGGVEPINGVSLVSATGVGARIFAADLDRFEFAGGLVGSRVPYAGLLRHESGVIFFLHESASVQVYKNEVAVTGMTASATPGQLRIAVPDGAGGYNTFEAGFDKPATPTVNVVTGGTKAMAGRTGVALAPWRTTTNAIGPPSEITYNDLQPTTADRINIVLTSVTPVSGQDGWIYAGTRPGDSSGALHIVRYVRLVARGTFTATNGSPNITAGIGTFFQQDLRAGDVVTIAGGSYTVSAVTSQATLTLTANFTAATAAGRTATLTTAAADWYNKEVSDQPIVRQDIVKVPPAAGVFQFAGHVFVWGVTDRTKNPSAVTGPAVVAMLDDNPEHCDARGLMLTEDGSDIVNVVAGDEQVYIMSTTGLFFASFTGEFPRPYRMRQVAQPGFKATTNGVVYKNVFYGHNKRPIRILPDGTADVAFNVPIWSDMTAWDPQRTVVTFDPNNEAVLYFFDNGTASTTVLPYLTGMERWNPPTVFANRFMDGAVVDGNLYLAYFNPLGPNYLVLLWEGSTGAQGYVATQYYRLSSLDLVNTIKRIPVAGKLASVTVFAALPGIATPDVSNTANGTTFNLSGVDDVDPTIFTDIDATLVALGFTMTAGLGHNFQSASVSAYTKQSQR